MRRFLRYLIIYFLCSFFGVFVSASPATLTYQGRILKSNGKPLEYGSVSFIFQITNPSGSCVVYEEQVDGYNMENSGGVFERPIGAASRSFPASGTFSILDSFNNSDILSCKGGSSFTPSQSDGRKLRVRFHDGLGWNLITPDSEIRSVPYAGHAETASKLGSFYAEDFLTKDIIPTCTTGKVLSWTGSAFACATFTGGSSSTASTDVVSTNAYLTVATVGTTASLTVKTGTTAGTVAVGNDSRIVNAMQSGAAAGGDLAGTYPSPIVAQIQGVAVNSAAPASGNFLKFNGAFWTGSSIATSDISGLSTAINSAVSSSLTGVVLQSQFPSGCSNSQTLTFSSPTGSFSCSAISINGSQVSGNILGAASGFTGALAGDVTGNQATTSVDKIKGVPVDMTGATVGKVLTFDGNKWIPDDLPVASTGNPGTVTNVSSANSYLTILNGTSAPALTLNVGNSANTVAAGNDSRIVNAIQNAGNVVSIQAGLDSGKGSGSVNGRIYIATDTQKIYRDNGSSLIVVASVDAAGGGGSVSEVAVGSGPLSIVNGTTTPVIDISKASVSTDGYITAAEWNSFNSKLSEVSNSANLADTKIWIGDSGGKAQPQSITGEVSLTSGGVTKVTGLQGRPVNVTAAVSGTYLKYDGTSWSGTAIAVADVSGLSAILSGQSTSITNITTSLASKIDAVNMPSSCSANQTLTFSSPSGSWVCSNISITGAAFGSKTANVFLASPNGSSGDPIFRGIATADLPSSVVNGLWTESSGDVSRPSGKVGIGTTTPEGALDVTSTTAAFVPPRMTTTQRDAIASPPDGAIIYNTTSNKLNLRQSGAWIDLGSASGAGSPCNPVVDSTFNADGTWTKPSCGTTVRVECWGGGGKGGTSARGTTINSDGSGTYYYRTSGGGGGGGFVAGSFPIEVVGATESVVIGEGGSSAGAKGGTSYFGFHLAAPGGGAGGSNSGTVAGAAGEGGIGGGDGGQDGFCGGGGGGNGGGGNGGASQCGGSGGKGGASGQNGTAGVAPGGGGGGALANGSNANRTGGNGAAGRCRIRVY